jgi:hypothetical protein
MLNFDKLSFFTRSLKILYKGKIMSKDDGDGLAGALAVVAVVYGAVKLIGGAAKLVGESLEERAQKKIVKKAEKEKRDAEWMENVRDQERKKKEQAREKAHQDKYDKLVADNPRSDVCYDCLTVDPPRCNSYNCTKCLICDGAYDPYSKYTVCRYDEDDD